MDTHYVIDPADRVVSFDAAWVAFAEANSAPRLPLRALGQSLWTFIADPSVRELSRTLLAGVRATGRRMTIPFRCDSPVVERFMTLTIGPGNGPRGTLAFCASLLREKAHGPRAAALHASVVAGAGAASGAEVDVLAPPLVMCSWCKRVDVDGWCEVDEAIARRADLLSNPAPSITHGICPDCHRSLLAGVA